MSRRLTLALLAALGCGWLAAASPGLADTPLCARFTVPDALELDCTERVDPGVGLRAVVAPEGGAFAALSRMSVRALDPATDRLAWEDPGAWLERQMILDLDGLAAAVRDLGEDPDSPFAGPMARSAIEYMVSGLEGLGRLPLAACGEGASDTELTCRFGVEPIGLVTRIMLAGEGEARFAFNMRTFNEQRLRHFTAIANSFEIP
jgi:hypothetical protein